MFMLYTVCVYTIHSVCITVYNIMATVHCSTYLIVQFLFHITRITFSCADWWVWHWFLSFYSEHYNKNTITKGRSLAELGCVRSVGAFICRTKCLLLPFQKWMVGNISALRSSYPKINRIWFVLLILKYSKHTVISSVLELKVQDCWALVLVTVNHILVDIL